MSYEILPGDHCLKCGAAIHIKPDDAHVQCSWCGNVMNVSRFTRKEKRLVQEMEEMRASVSQTGEQTAELAKKIEEMRVGFSASLDGQLRELFRQGEEAQRVGRFDEAIRHYQALLVKSPEPEAEVHWRIMLCRYGVEYVKEQSSGSYLPTITRMDVSSILQDSSYLSAREHASDDRVRMFYTQEAQRINGILLRYQEINGTESPYDVFISVKQGDSEGKPTNDSITAMELYNMLDKMGLKVFNSRISLSQYSGFEYEPYIMHALSTAKVMIVVASTEEYMNAPWLRNEWRRFYWLQKNNQDAARRLIAYILGGEKWNMQELGALQIIYPLTHTNPKAALRDAVEQSCGKQAEPLGIKGKHEPNKPVVRKKAGVILAAIIMVAVLVLMVGQRFDFRNTASVSGSDLSGEATEDRLDDFEWQTATMVIHTEAPTPDAAVVEAVQRRLIELSWMDESQSTSVFDNATALALKDYQTYINQINPNAELPEDGYPDENTLFWLNWVGAPERPNALEWQMATMVVRTEAPTLTAMSALEPTNSQPSGSQYLLDACPPYQKNGFEFASQNDGTSFSMAGQKYTNGMKTVYYWSGEHPYALFNLNGRYTTLSFVAGHVDGEEMQDGRVLIYLDGKLASEHDIISDDLPSKIKVDLKNASQMKIVVEGYYGACAIADLVVEGDEF